MPENMNQKPVIMNEKPKEFVIEISTDKCNSVAFPPTKDHLRGRWVKAKVLVGVSSRADLHKVPDIPGLCVSLDCTRKVGKIFDPLADPESRSLLESIKGPYKVITGQDGGPEKERVYRDMSDTMVKTWAYWMRKLVDAGCAVVVSGILPSFEDIEKLQGKTQLELYRTTSGPKVYKEDKKEEEVLV